MITLPEAVSGDLTLQKDTNVFQMLSKEEPARIICIGMPDKIYKAVQNQNGKEAFVSVQEKNLWRSLYPENVFIGNDGIRIRIE